MTDEAAERLVEEIKGHYGPSVTPAQGQYWLKWLVDRVDSPAVARRALDRLLQTSQSFNTTLFHQLLLDEQANERLSRPDPVREQERQREAEIQAKWEQIDATIAALSDDELAAHVQAILPELPPATRRLDPRKSSSIKWHVYQRLTFHR